MLVLEADILQLHPAVAWVVCIGAFVAACIDLYCRRIPNALTTPMLAAGFAWALWSQGLWGLAESVAASLLLALPYILLFLFWRGGAGDAKLMGAIGAWVGLAHGVFVLFSVAVSGALIAVVMLMISGRRTHRPLAAAGANDDRNAVGKPPVNAPRPTGHTMPYGAAVFVGVCAWLIGVLACS